MRITRNTSRFPAGFSTYSPDGLPSYRGGNGGAAFDPASIVGAGDTALILDFTDRTKTYQDVLKTTPALLDGDPVRAVEPQPHDGIQLPDLLYNTGSNMSLTSDGATLGASSTKMRVDTIGAVGIMDHSNGITIASGVCESLEQGGMYASTKNSGANTQIFRRQNSAGGQLDCRYGDAPTQIIVADRDFGTFKSLASKGSSTTGGVYEDGVQFGSDFTLVSPTSTGSQIWLIQIGLGNPDAIIKRYFFINRELTNEEFANINAWVIGQ